MSVVDSVIELERELEHYQEMLHDYDRSLRDKLVSGGKPSLDQRQERSRIIRQLNRVRRRLVRVRKGSLQEPMRRITLRLPESEYARLQAQAEEEGLSLPAYIRVKLHQGE
jgi:predicted DNA binding CopG/RHH family protein